MNMRRHRRLRRAWTCAELEAHVRAKYLGAGWRYVLFVHPN